MYQRRYCKAVLKNEKFEARGPVLEESRTRLRAQLFMKEELDEIEESYDQDRELIPSESLTPHRQLKKVPSENIQISASSNRDHDNSQSSYQDERSFYYSQDGVARANKVPQHGRWTEAEHKRFLEGLRLYKKDWRMIEEHIGTRTCSQIRSHAQKFFLRLQKQQLEMKGEGLCAENQRIFEDLETLC